MNWALLQNSLLVSAAATALATLCGVLAALAISALERRWRNAALALTITALALPPFLVTNCWLHYLGATGAWRTWLPFNLFSLGGAAWLLALQLWPVSALATWAAWQTVEPPLLEADPAARGWALLRWLLLPLAGKALGFAALLTFVLALNNFAVPAILQVKVLPAEVWVQFSTNLDPLAALRVGWPLVLAPLLVLPWLARQDVPWPRRTGTAPARSFRRQLGAGWLGASLAVTVVLLAFSVALPVVQLAGSARTWTELPAAVEAGGSAVWHSFAFAALTATVVAVGGVVMAMAEKDGRNPKSEVRSPESERNPKSETRNPKEIRSPKSEIRNQPERSSLSSRTVFGFRISDFGFRTFLAWLPFFIPGVLLGIGLIALFNHPATFWLYRGAGIVVLALAVRYFALGWNGAVLALRQTDPDLTDAARLEGATRWPLMRHVLWPQIAPQIAAAWYVVYLLCLWDVESLVLIVPPGGETLALRIFNLLHYGHNAQVNALCLTLLALALAPLAVLLASNGTVRAAQRWARRRQ